eukprot:3727542-Heterocapsa_arctica.AAC.1
MLGVTDSATYGQRWRYTSVKSGILKIIKPGQTYAVVCINKPPTVHNNHIRDIEMSLKLLWDYSQTTTTVQHNFNNTTTQSPRWHDTHTTT